jgi:hypothetical protein
LDPLVASKAPAVELALPGHSTLDATLVLGFHSL